MDSLEIAEAVLVGQSMGGMTILPFAVRNPQRVRGLRMADTFVGIDAPELVKEMRKVVEVARANQASGGLNPPLDPDRPLSWDREDGAIAKDKLGALTMPVFFLVGAEDAIIPPALIERAAEMVPGAQYYQIPSAGHSVYWEQPEDFNRILDALLAESFA